MLVWMHVSELWYKANDSMQHVYMYNYVSFILYKVGTYQLYYDCRCILTALQLLVNAMCCRTV